jgi:hypothetical protein
MTEETAQLSSSRSCSEPALTTKARSVKVTPSRPVRYELDGGDRTKVKKFKVKAKAHAITVGVPPADPSHEVGPSEARE